MRPFRLWLWQLGVHCAVNNITWGKFLPGYAWAKQFPSSAAHVMTIRAARKARGRE